MPSHDPELDFWRCFKFFGHFSYALAATADSPIFLGYLSGEMKSCSRAAKAAAEGRFIYMKPEYGEGFMFHKGVAAEGLAKYHGAQIEGDMLLKAKRGRLIVWRGDGLYDVWIRLRHGISPAQHTLWMARMGSKFDGFQGRWGIAPGFVGARIVWHELHPVEVPTLPEPHHGFQRTYWR